jgi:hypothetical protein
MRDAEVDLAVCRLSKEDDFRIDVVLPYWITRAQQLEARVMELEEELKWEPINTAPRLNTSDIILACQVSGDKKHKRLMLVRNTFEPDNKHETASPGVCWQEIGCDWPSYPTHWKNVNPPT